VFGQRAGQYAAEFAKRNGSVRIDERQVQDAAASALEPFERGPAADNPYAIQHALQEDMQNLVGIVRTRDEMEQALNCIERFRARAARAGIGGNRQYNNGWHTCLDLANMLDVAEGITRAALMREESRGAQFRDDFPNKDSEWGKYNLVVRRAEGSEMLVERRPIEPMPKELQQVIEEMK